MSIIPPSNARSTWRGRVVVTTSNDDVSASEISDSNLVNTALAFTLGPFLNSFGKYLNNSGANIPNPIDKAQRNLRAISTQRLFSNNKSQLNTELFLRSQQRYPSFSSVSTVLTQTSPPVPVNSSTMVLAIRPCKQSSVKFE